MRSFKLLLTVVLVIASFCSDSFAAVIKDGTIKYPAGSFLGGQPLKLGVDPYGYNYQARSFNESYFNAYANGAGLPPYDGNDAAYLAANPWASLHWAWPYRHDQLAMKWNDAWLSNADLDNDGKLDRHYGYPTYRGSGAWLTNHGSGEYEDANGQQSWNYFSKIVAAPLDAVKVADLWIGSDGDVIGLDIWGEFAIVQTRVYDSGTGEHGIGYLSPSGPGFGQY